jgi:hypothetical protein
VSRQDDLERVLADLGAHLEYPPTPPLAGMVAERLAAAPARRGRAPRWLAGRRRALIAIAVALLLLAGLLLEPAVARRLGLRGVEIHLGGRPPATTPPASTPPAASAIGERLGLGARVPLARARAEVRFRLLLPTDPGLGPPDLAFVGNALPGGRADLVWRPRAGLPPSRYTDVGLLLTEFLGTNTPEFVKKTETGGGHVEEVTVAGEPGYWLSGGPHFVTFQDANGVPSSDSTRLAGNVLLWQHGNLTLRLEGEVTQQQALRIAGSLG